MNLNGCKDQSDQHLAEFYAEAMQSESARRRETAAVMLALIARLRGLPHDHQVYGLTSHDRLCLLAQDSYQSPWFVIVSVLDRQNYEVEYLMTENDRPWPHAYVKGCVCSEDDAVRMIEIAIERSEGWIQR